MVNYCNLILYGLQQNYRTECLNSLLANVEAVTHRINDDVNSLLIYAIKTAKMSLFSLKTVVSGRKAFIFHFCLKSVVT